MEINWELIVQGERIERNGGPHSYGAALVYHQYLDQKKRLEYSRLEPDEILERILLKMEEIRELKKTAEEFRNVIGEERNRKEFREKEGLLIDARRDLNRLLRALRI